MARGLIIALLCGLLPGVSFLPEAAGQTQSVVTYHGHADRSGHFVVPELTWERAASAHLDLSFSGIVAGNIYAQPLYWRAPESDTGLLIVATEDNTVYALNAATGTQVWQTSLGQPVRLASLPCGNIDPLGITGTPVIDETTQAVYLDAFVSGTDGAQPQHLLFGLSLLNGSVLPGWPVNVADALLRLGTTFTPLVQNQRGALAIADSVLYVPYGGHAGDCGQYHGTVLGVPLLAPSAFTAWITRGLAGGIWAPGGISFDGQSLYIATGNTMGASEWADGEAVIRLPPALSHSDQPQDFFAPSDWQQLDAADADLGGSNPLPLDVPGPGGTSALIMALGKDGKAYLLDRTNLGGIGGSLVEEMVANAPIRTAPVRYSLADSVLVAFQAEGSACPASAPGSGLVALRVQSGPPPSLGTAWCAPLNGHGNPIVTTTDGISDPIVWVVGAEGDNRLHGFRGDTGEPIFAGGGPSDAMAGLRHFVTILAAQGRLYVAADGQIYAFTY